MFRRLAFAGVAVVATGLVSAAQAQDKWVKVADSEIDVTRDSGVVDLSKSKGSFKAFRVVLPKGTLALSNIQVRYSDGQSWDERRAINLLQGERTRPINQGAQERFVEGMTLCFKAQPGVRDRATVQVEGLQSTKGASANRPAVTAARTWAAACPGGQAITIAAPAGATPQTTGPAPATGQLPAVPTASAPVTAKAGADVGGAVLFGVQYVGFVRDRDVIKVGANLGQFDRIQLRVLDNDITIREIDVIYANGETQKLVVNAEVKRDTRTRWLDLRGDRFIREINLLYASKPNLRGQARIEVYGQYSENWLGPKGRGREFNEGWVLLGAQTAGRFLRTETDIIPVGRNEGSFKRVRVTVKDRALVLDELTIVYGNNETEVIPVKTTVAANSTYGPIDLKGNRSIKEIRAKYRSAVLDSKAVGRGASVVEVWGQH